MSTHFVYIIYSQSFDRYYIGETHNVVRRLEKHNSHSYKGAYTKSASDWKAVLIFECDSVEKARFLEQFIKKMKNRRFVEKVVGNPHILKDILSKHF